MQLISSRTRSLALVLGTCLLAASAQPTRSAVAAALAPARVAASPWLDLSQSLEQRIDAMLGQLTLEEKTTLLHSADAPVGVHSVGYVAGVPRLGIPPLRLADGPGGVRDGLPATAMPAPVSLAASFDPALANTYGTVLGREARARGYQVLYSPMVNIVRIPQGGRNFETFGEDPYLAGRIAAAQIRGIQSQQVAAQVKHYVANNQEDNRMSFSSDVDERTLNEIELPAFEAAVRDGRSWSSMCGYNRVNGNWACEHFPLLHDVLKGRWGFDGVVGSDYPATHSTVNAAAAGLDQEFGGSTYFNALADAVNGGRLAPAVVDDQTRRVLRLMFRTGVFDGGGNPPADPAAGARDARAAAVAGTVLLKNERATLPLNPTALHSLAVVGPWADRVYTGGGGSSHVTPYGEFTLSPRSGITARAGGGVSVRYHDGRDRDAAATLAAGADVAVVVVGDDETEGADRSSIELSAEDNALVQAVARANARTVVVLNTGGPVTMPWLDAVPAVLETWYPGEQDGAALADVLFGDADPGGRLPLTFPTSLSATPITDPAQYPGVNETYSYSERLRVGYRWYDASGTPPLFAFGHGLSYTTFGYSGLSVRGPDASGRVQVEFDVTNRGSRSGSEVPQLYVAFPSAAGEPPQQLKGFGKVALSPGHSQRVSLWLDRSSFATWDPGAHGWQVPGGRYGITVGASSRDARLNGSVEVPASPTVSAWAGRITGGDGRCLDAAAAAGSTAEAVRITGCEGTAAQELTVSSDGTLRALGSCLHAAGTGNRAPVRLLECTGQGAQVWTARPDTTLVNPASGRCLDSDGARLELWDCHGGANQRWYTPRPSGPVTGIAGKCVDVNGAATVNGTAVQLYRCNETGAQDWTVRQDDSLRAFGKCLDVKDGRTANGTQVQLYDCNGTGAQRWTPRPDGTLVNPPSGRCLDDPGSGAADFDRLLIWDCHGGANQRWVLPA